MPLITINSSLKRLKAQHDALRVEVDCSRERLLAREIKVSTELDVVIDRAAKLNISIDSGAAQVYFLEREITCSISLKSRRF